MSAEQAQPNKLTLVSSDNVSMDVARPVAERSLLIKNLLSDLPNEISEPIPIPNVNDTILKKVMEWCEHHVNDAPATADDDTDSRRKQTDIEDWDQKFMNVDQEMLFEIILAANYLDIKPLLDVGCKTVANMIKGKSPEEIRKTFNIQNDFTPEEEDQIRRENEWAEDRRDDANASRHQPANGPATIAPSTATWTRAQGEAMVDAQSDRLRTEHGLQLGPAKDGRKPDSIAPGHAVLSLLATNPSPNIDFFTIRLGSRTFTIRNTSRPPSVFNLLNISHKRKISVANLTTDIKAEPVTKRVRRTSVTAQQPNTSINQADEPSESSSDAPGLSSDEDDEYEDLGSDEDDEEVHVQAGPRTQPTRQCKRKGNTEA